MSIEIYDGIPWVGNTPILGPKVFDLQQDAAANMLAVDRVSQADALRGVYA